MRIRLIFALLLATASACGGRAISTDAAADRPDTAARGDVGFHSPRFDQTPQPPDGAPEGGAKDTGATLDTAPDVQPVCGAPDQVCCSGNICRDGGCCASQRIDRQFYCVSAEGACEGSGGTCRAGSCGGCGGIGQPCCQGHCTAPRSVCHAPAGVIQCVACGGPGQPCCAGQPGHRPECFAAGHSCDAAGLCSPCGPEGQTCCDGLVACPAGTTCGAGGTCERCGALGTLCCGGISCVSGATCDPGTGRCAACGNLGELCCDARECSAPSSVCFPGEFDDPGTNPALCVPCGGAGQRCCSMGLCRSPLTCTTQDQGGVCSV